MNEIANALNSLGALGVKPALPALNTWSRFSTLIVIVVAGIRIMGPLGTLSSALLDLLINSLENIILKHVFIINRAVSSWHVQPAHVLSIFITVQVIVGTISRSIAR